MLSERDIKLLDYLEEGYITVDSVKNDADPMYYAKNPVKLTGHEGECYTAAQGDKGISLAPFKAIDPELLKDLSYGCYSISELQENKWFSYLLQKNLSI